MGQYFLDTKYLSMSTPAYREMFGGVDAVTVPLLLSPLSVLDVDGYRWLGYYNRYPVLNGCKNAR